MLFRSWRLCWRLYWLYCRHTVASLRCFAVILGTTGASTATVGGQSRAYMQDFGAVMHWLAVVGQAVWLPLDALEGLEGFRRDLEGLSGVRSAP